MEGVTLQQASKLGFSQASAATYLDGIIGPSSYHFGNSVNAQYYDSVTLITSKSIAVTTSTKILSFSIYNGNPSTIISNSDMAYCYVNNAIHYADFP